MCCFRSTESAKIPCKVDAAGDRASVERVIATKPVHRSNTTCRGCNAERQCDNSLTLEMTKRR